MAKVTINTDLVTTTETESSLITLIPIRKIDLIAVGETPNKGLVARPEGQKKNLWALVYGHTFNKERAHVAIKRVNDKSVAGTCKIHDATQRMEITLNFPNGKSLTVNQMQNGLVNRKYKVQLPFAPAESSDSKKICFWKNTDAHGSKNGITLVNHTEEVLYAAMIPIADEKRPFQILIYKSGLSDNFIEEIIFTGAVLMEKKHLYRGKFERSLAGGVGGIIGAVVATAAQHSGPYRHGHW